ncbi:hypothetical protein [Actinokineospora sp. HUAS TT18]|uniref:hypothetical protein n=1 Tax=Actinokineospora sp. HUAS TT18 TaxID=3447451 RepID=UPI003F51CA3A
MTESPRAVPRLAMMVRLVAGRGAFRISSQVMAIALVVVWGADEFGGYANALGLCSWLVYLTMAPEKAALRTLPRTRATTDAVARLVVLGAVAPVAAALAVLVVALAVAPDSPATLYLAAAVWSLAGGTMMTIASLHRLRGRHWLDAAAFTAGAVAVLGATGATWLIRWSPLHHLLVLLAATLAVLGATIAALPRAWLIGRGRPGLLGRLARTSGLLGLSDVLNALAGSSVYLMLALHGRTADSGPFYLALLLSGMVCQFLYYQLKLAQPGVSARLRGPGAAQGRAKARALLRRAERLGLAVAGVFAVAVAFPAVRAFVDAGGVRTIAVLVVLVCAEVGVFLLVMYAGFLLENTNGKALTTTASAAAAGLVATVVFAAVAVPAFGAVGGFLAMLLATAVNAFAMRRILQHRHPELSSPDLPARDRVTVP